MVLGKRGSCPATPCRLAAWCRRTKGIYHANRPGCWSETRGHGKSGWREVRGIDHVIKGASSQQEPQISLLDDSAQVARDLSPPGQGPRRPVGVWKRQQSGFAQSVQGSPSQSERRECATLFVYFFFFFF